MGSRGSPGAQHSQADHQGELVLDRLATRFNRHRVCGQPRAIWGGSSLSWS